MYQECRHIMTSGKKCRGAALTCRAYCYFHFRLNQQRHRVVDHYKDFVSYKFDVPVLEDRASIQLAISEVVQAMARNYMDHKRGGKILYGLQLALQSAKVPADIVSTEPVRELYRNAEGEEIGPKATFYEEGDEKEAVPEEKEEDRSEEIGVGESVENERVTTEDREADESEELKVIAEAMDSSEVEETEEEEVRREIRRANVREFELSEGGHSKLVRERHGPETLGQSLRDLAADLARPHDPHLGQSKDPCSWEVGFDASPNQQRQLRETKPVELHASGPTAIPTAVHDQQETIGRDPLGPGTLAQTIRDCAADLIRRNPQLLRRIRR